MRTVDEILSELVETIEAGCRERLVEGLRGGLTKAGPRRSTAFVKASAALKSKPKPKPARRDSGAIAETQATLLAHIKKHPGQRVMEIGPALGLGTKDLSLPLRKLVEGKEVKTKGARSHTTYTAA